MTDPDTISADYTLRPSELAATLALLVEARQPCVVWGPPGAAKSMIAQQVAADAGRQYVDVRALLLDPVDLRGIPWRDGADRTRWAPPAFLPPTDDAGRWLINLEELPSAVPMVQAALYQLVLDRKVGEYELPEGASLIACGNRESDRGVVHRMPTPLASRFVHLEIRVDAQDWLAWGAENGIAPETLFFISMRPELLHQFDPQSREKAFPCPRTWEMISNIVHRRNGLDPAVERALFRGTVGEAAAVEFSAFLKVWRELPHPPHRHGRSRERRRSRQRQRAYRPSAVRSTAWPTTSISAPSSPTRCGSGARSASSSSVRASAANPTCSTLKPSSAGPLPGRSDIARQETLPMNLTHDAMLVSLRINAWSGRLYDRQASNHVAPTRRHGQRRALQQAPPCPRPPSPCSPPP